MTTLQVAQPDPRIDEFFWIKWVLANAIGFAIGAAVPSALHQAIVRPLVGTVSGRVDSVVSWILSWVYAIFGAVAIAAAQWFFLRRRVGWAKAWFLVTSLGWLAGQWIVANIAGAADWPIGRSVSIFDCISYGVWTIILIAPKEPFHPNCLSHSLELVLY